MARSQLLDAVRDAIRVRHYSIRTEQSYIQWNKRCIFFHNKRHPREMGEPDITQFLTNLAVEKNISASMQNQALSAILFLYKEVLKQELEWISDVVMAKTEATTGSYDQGRSEEAFVTYGWHKPISGTALTWIRDEVNGSHQAARQGYQF